MLGEITIHPQKFLIIFIRTFGFLYISPVFYSFKNPYIIKVILSLAISIAIYSIVNINFSNDINYLRFLSELLIGMSMGFIVSMGFEVFKYFGSLVDFQSGLMMASIFDPATGEQNTIFSKLINFLGLFLFISFNGHLFIIKALLESFNSFGDFHFLSYKSAWVILYYFSQFLALSIKISLPVIVILILIEICIGIFSKMMPAVNFLIIGQPIRFIAGGFFLFLTIYSFNNISQMVFSNTFELLSSFIINL